MKWTWLCGHDVLILSFPNLYECFGWCNPIAVIRPSIFKRVWIFSHFECPNRFFMFALLLSHLRRSKTTAKWSFSLLLVWYTYSWTWNLSCSIMCVTRYETSETQPSLLVSTRYTFYHLGDLESADCMFTSRTAIRRGRVQRSVESSVRLLNAARLLVSET